MDISLEQPAVTDLATEVAVFILIHTNRPRTCWFQNHKRVGSYLWLLRDVEAGVSGSDADEPLSWRCGGGGVRCTEHIGELGGGRSPV